MKDVTQMSLQELMEIAKNPIKEDEFRKLTPARRFILSDGVEAGDYKMPALLIYDRYVKWANAYKIKPVNKVEFFKEFAKYFKKSRTTEGFVYLMSPKGFDLSLEYLAIIKEKYKIAKVKRNSSGTQKVKKERASKVARKSESDENP